METALRPLPGLLSLLTIVVASTPMSAWAQLRGPEVAEVRFEGNETFPSASLARAIATRDTECRTWVFKLLPLCPLGVDFALNRSSLRTRDLPRDRARLVLWYRQRGFRDVQVDTPAVESAGNGVRVVFRVEEGRPVIADSVGFVGLEDETGRALVEDGVLEELPIAPGDRLSTIALDATRDSITSRLSDRGFAYAEVYRNALRPADDPYNAIVTFEIVPGPLATYGDITVDGIVNLSVATVLRTVQINSGELYRRSEIQEAGARLYGLDIVRSASVMPDTVAVERDSIIDVAITVQEGDPFRVRAGSGWSTAECLNAEARWTSRNFLGGGRLLQIRGRVGNLLASEFRDAICTDSGEGDFARLTGLASVELVQPWIFSTRNSLSASIFVERQSLPEVFIRRAIGVQLALSRTIAPQTVLTGSYRPELSELAAADVLFCTGFLVCTPDDINRLAGSNLLSPVGLTLTRDRSDDLLNPRRGYRLVVDIEHAARWTTSDFRYDRVVAEASRYTPVGSTVFATRIRGGWVGSEGFRDLVGDEESVDIVHPQKRFYTGGANSVRGFAQSRLGPRVLVAAAENLLAMDGEGGGCLPVEVVDGSCVPDEGTRFNPRPTGGTRVLEANAELRFPVASLFEGVVFGDVGQAWARGEDPALGDLEFTPGIGVRFPSPVGPIRVDLAYRFRGAENLDVVTEQIRPFDPAVDDEADRLLIRGIAGTGEALTPIDWVSTGQLSSLGRPVLFGSGDQGLQLHVSIGQAF